MEKLPTPFIFSLAVASLEGAFLLDGGEFLLRVGCDGQHHLHFVAVGGVWDLVDLGKALTDVHECFIFGLWQDDIKIEGCQDAYRHEHQEGKRLQLLLREQKQAGRSVKSALTPPSCHVQVSRRFSIMCFFLFSFEINPQRTPGNLVQWVMPITGISDRFKNTRWLITPREL